MGKLVQVPTGFPSLWIHFLVLFVSLTGQQMILPQWDMVAEECFKKYSLLYKYIQSQNVVFLLDKKLKFLYAQV